MICHWCPVHGVLDSHNYTVNLNPLEWVGRPYEYRNYWVCEECVEEGINDDQELMPCVVLE